MTKERNETKVVTQAKEKTISEQIEAIKKDLNTLAKEVYDPKRLEINKGN